MKKVNIRKPAAEAVKEEILEEEILEEEILEDTVEEEVIDEKPERTVNRKSTTASDTKTTKKTTPKTTSTKKTTPKTTSTKKTTPKTTSTKKTASTKKTTPKTVKKVVEEKKEEIKEIEFPVLDGGNNDRLTTDESYSYLKYLISKNYPRLQTLNKSQIIDTMHLIGEMVYDLNSMGYSCSPFGTVVKCTSKTKAAVVYTYNSALKGSEGINTLKYPSQIATIKAATYGGQTIQSSNDPEYDEDGKIVAFITENNERILLEDINDEFEKELVENRKG